MRATVNDVPRKVKRPPSAVVLLLPSLSKASRSLGAFIGVFTGGCFFS
jgi:hypothetical protein